MRVAIMQTKPTLRATYLLESFAQGVALHGDTPVTVDGSGEWPDLLRSCDVGVQVCYPNRHKSGNRVGEFRVASNDVMQRAGKRLLTIDTGFIRNQSEYELMVAASTRKHEVLFDIDKKETYERVLREIYYEVGYDGLKRHADYGIRLGEAPPDRWQALQKELKPWRTTGDHILLVGQTLFGLSSQHVDIYQWYRDVVTELRKRTQRPIVFRHHPRLVKVRKEGSRLEKDRRAIRNALGNPKNFHWSTGWTIEDDLKNAWAAVVFSSNAAVTCALEGIPVFVLDPGCMAWDISHHRLKSIESPLLSERQAWANWIAYAQYNVAEMQDGTAWSRLRPHAIKSSP